MFYQNTRDECITSQEYLKFLVCHLKLSADQQLLGPHQYLHSIEKTFFFFKKKAQFIVEQ